MCIRDSCSGSIGHQHNVGIISLRLLAHHFILLRLFKPLSYLQIVFEQRLGLKVDGVDQTGSCLLYTSKRIILSHFRNQSDQILDRAGLNSSPFRGNTLRRRWHASVHRNTVDNKQAACGRYGVNMHVNGISAHGKPPAV